MQKLFTVAEVYQLINESILEFFHYFNVKKKIILSADDLIPLFIYLVSSSQND